MKKLPRHMTTSVLRAEAEALTVHELREEVRLCAHHSRTFRSEYSLDDEATIRRWMVRRVAVARAVLRRRGVC